MDSRTAAALEWAKTEHPSIIDVAPGAAGPPAAPRCAFDVTPLRETAQYRRAVRIMQADEAYERWIQHGAESPAEFARRRYAIVTGAATVCSHCDGTGWITSYDSVDYGSTTVSMPSTEPCMYCAAGRAAAITDGWVDADEVQP